VPSDIVTVAYRRWVIQRWRVFKSDHSRASFAASLDNRAFGRRSACHWAIVPPDSEGETYELRLCGFNHGVMSRSSMEIAPEGVPPDSPGWLQCLGRGQTGACRHPSLYAAVRRSTPAGVEIVVPPNRA
jgi:hypothetical protein